MKKSDFYYDLPEELIAQHPSNKRDCSSLLFFDPDKQLLEHNKFFEIEKYLEAGDVLVLNNSRVIPARLFGRKDGMSREIEVLLLKRVENDDFVCLLKPAKRVKIGEKIYFTDDRSFSAEVIDILDDGQRLIRFYYTGIWEERLDELGNMPLPPYIKEKLTDKERYQTVYAKERGSAAAPTAGLHFTEALLEKLQAKGIQIAYVTLHVGLGTFRPVKEENVDKHIMHSEYYQIDARNAEIINAAKREKRRVIAVGTTSTRVLESIADCHGFVSAKVGETDIFIKPPYKFKVIDALITNFHLPESTLLMLVASLVGYNNILSLYERAVELKYRFFSFGDAMFLLKKKDGDTDAEVDKSIYKRREFQEEFSSEYIKDNN